MTEKLLESQILTWLNYQPETFAFKINTVGIYDVKKQCFRKNRNPFVHCGTSDILGIHHGQFFAIEVKTPLAMRASISNPKERDRFQNLFIEKVRNVRGHAIKVDSLSQVEEFFKTIRYK